MMGSANHEHACGVMTIYIVLHSTESWPVFGRLARLLPDYFQREVYMTNALVDTARADNVHISCQVPIENVLLRKPTTDFNQELPLPFPLLLQSTGRSPYFLRLEIVKHDYVRTCTDGFAGFFLALALNLYFHGEASDSLRGVNRAGDAPTASHDVVVLEHNHGTEIMSVRIDPADKHTVLFDKAKSRGGFASSGKYVGIARFADGLQEVRGPDDPKESKLGSADGQGKHLCAR